MNRYVFLSLFLIGLSLFPPPLMGGGENENRQEREEMWVPDFSLDRGLRLKPNTQQGFSDETLMPLRGTKEHENVTLNLFQGLNEMPKQVRHDSLEGFSGEMVLIPEGEFIMGSSPEKDGRRGFDFGVDEEPRHIVSVKAFYIDRYETKIAEYKEYLKATGKEWFGDSTITEEYPPEIYLNKPEMDKHPASYISWHDANDYCKWRGKRLPIEAEWEKAARGIDGRRWPWGDEFDPSKAHVEENGTPGWTAPIGSYPEDRSPYGVFDMTGNVSEWTASYYLPHPGNPFDDGRYSRNAYVLKGASFLLPGSLYGRPAARSLAYPEYDHRMYGLRCAKDAP